MYFHSNQYPSKVWKNGTSITSGNFSLSTINSYMILRIVVNGNNLGPHSPGKSVMMARAGVWIWTWLKQFVSPMIIQC